MKCSVAVEALSAWIDGEDADARPVEVSRHLAGCADCTTYAERLGGLSDLTAALQRVPVPDRDLEPAYVAPPTRRPRRVRWLCLGLVLLSVLELAASLAELAADHGYAGEDHAGHETLSFTLAVCAGLVWIAWRPAYARSYLPLVGVAAFLLGVTAAVDVARGRTGLVEELPHLGFLVGFVLLWLLARGSWGTRGPGGDPAASPSRPRPPASAPASRLRVVRGAVRAAVLAGVAVVVLVASPSWGHATLESSTPGPDAVLTTLPGSVALRFDEPVTTLPTSLEVYGPDGARVDDGAVTHPGGDGARVSVGIGGRQRGTYLVSWRVVSADSHPVSGAFTFSVGRRTAAPTAPAEHTDPLVGGLLGGARWLGYAGAALGIGGVAFLLLCWPAGWSAAGPRRLVALGLGLMALGSALALVLKGPYDAALGLSAVTDRSLVHEVLVSTYGRALLVRLGLVVVAGLLLGARGRFGIARITRITGLVVVGVGLLATYAAAGHAVSDDPRWLAVPVDMVHVGAMSVWLGGLVMLLVCVLRPGARSEGVPAARVARRFSAVALTAVALLVATGSYQAWRQVRSWAALTATTYGRELMFKLLVVAAVLVVAAASRRWVRGHATDLSVLRRRVGVEAAGIAVVLGLTSALVATDPARSAYHPSVAADLALGPDLVQVSAVPAGDRRMEVHLYVFDRDRRPTEPRALSATVSLESPRIGPLPVSLTRVGRGHRVADVAVPVAGDWSLEVDLRTSPIDEYTRTVTLPIR